MVTSGQQLGRIEADTSAARPFEPMEVAGRGASAVEGGRFDARESVFSSLGAPLGGSPVPQQPDILRFQFVEPRSRWQRVDWNARYQPPRLQDSWSRSPAVAIESMVRQLLVRDRILAARKLVQAVPSDQVVERSLRRLRVVLAEPVIRRRIPARARCSGDIDWLRRNSGNYAGRWVALVDGTLLAAADSLSELRRRLKGRAADARLVLHRL